MGEIFVPLSIWCRDVDERRIQWGKLVLGEVLDGDLGGLVLLRARHRTRGHVDADIGAQAKRGDLVVEDLADDALPWGAVALLFGELELGGEVGLPGMGTGR